MFHSETSGKWNGQSTIEFNAKSHFWHFTRHKETFVSAFLSRCIALSVFVFVFFVVFSFFGVTIILFSNFFRGYDPDFYIKICLIYFGDVFLFCLSGLWVYHLGAQYYFNPQHIV